MPPTIDPASAAATARANRRLLAILGVIPLILAAFFLFFFKDFYRMWCSFTGTRLNPNNNSVVQVPSQSTGRFITARFESKVFDRLPIEFGCSLTQDRIEVGTDHRITYRFRNTSDHPLHVRPIHQVSPINATTAFAMKVCFCFQDQVIAPGEVKEFPVVYRFSPALDARINDVSLCYSVFNIADGKASDELRAAESAAKRAILQEEP